MLSSPCAKINLGLFVTSLRPDGYHDILTAFYPIPLCDALEITPSKSGADEFFASGIKIEGDPGSNLVVRVCRDMQREFSLPPLSISLRKNIPTQAGLGGGSSDAAETMKCLNEMFDLGLSESDMRSRIAAYGADCPFFISRRPALATGTGTTLFPLDGVSLGGMWIAVVRPSISVSTREAYAATSPHEPEFDLAETLRGDVEAWRGKVINDFEDSVFPRHPEIGAIKQTLYDMGAVFALMSGSGSAVYGLFRRPVEEEVKSVFATDCFVYTKRLSR